MEKGSRTHPPKVLGEAWLIGLATLSAVFLAVIAAGRDPGRSAHEAVMMNLRAIDGSHAAVQRDVLRARAGLLLSYDPLVNSVVSLRRTVATLQELFASSDFGSDGSLERLLSQLQEAIDADEALVEQFKTRNALLQNSIGVFGQTLTALHQSSNPRTKLVLAEVGDLGNLMMRFSTQPDGEVERAIRTRLQQLMQSITASPAVEDVQTLTTHARMILAILPLVDAAVTAVQASGTPSLAEKLQARYLDIAGQTNARDAASRMLLGAIAIGLCIYVFVLVYRLRRQTERLKRRLHFEQVIAEIKAEMINTSRRDFPDFMEHSLETVSCLFDADGCGFAILNTETGEMKNAYQLNGQEEEYRPLLLDFARDLQGREDLDLRHASDVSAHLNLLKPNDLAYTRDTAVSGVLIGARLPDRHVAVMLILFETSRPKIAADEIGLMQATVRTLAEFVEANRSQQERDALEHRLEHAQRLEAIGTLAGGIAHEFNNVLGAILGYGEMALQLLRKPSMTRHYVQEILTSGERAKHIVDQILTFSRKRERAIKPFDVTEAVADILPLLEVTLGSKVSLKARLSDQPAVVEGNPVEVHQIVMNLCKNAMEASGRGQEVMMEVKHSEITRRRMLSHGEISPGSYVYLSVQDQGRGIPDHVLAHVFEPFFTTKSATGGTGLGLSAVHGSVTGLGGKINVYSMPGSGTRVEIFLPASRLPPVPIKSFFDERSVPTGRGQRVIIVEKDRSLLEMYEEKIAALGYEPLGYTSIDAVERSLNQASTVPDLVIVDRNTLEPNFPVSKLQYVVPRGRFLLLVDGEREPDRAPLPLSSTMLKKPFSSTALAHAIFDRISLPA